MDGRPPIEGFIFAHLYLSDVEEIMYRALTQPDGRFRFSGLPEGTYEIKDFYLLASTGEHVRPNPIVFEALSGETTRLDIIVTH